MKNRIELYIRLKHYQNVEQSLIPFYKIIKSYFNNDFYIRKKHNLLPLNNDFFKTNLIHKSNEQSIAGRLHTSMNLKNNILIEWYFTNPKWIFDKYLNFLRIEISNDNKQKLLELSNVLKKELNWENIWILNLDTLKKEIDIEN